MDYLVLRDRVVVGRAIVTPIDDAAAGRDGDDARGCVGLSGHLVPTVAYGAIRPACEALTRVMLGKLAEAQQRVPPPGAGTEMWGVVSTLESDDPMARALEALEALELRLATADGRPVEGAHVILQDLAPMLGDRLGTEAPAAPILVLATLADGQRK